jgi:hypothetical protein
MRIKYYLLENPITADTNDRRAQVFDYEIITEEEIFEYMTREGSAITMAEAKANYEEITGTFEYFLNRGYGFNTAFLKIRPVMPGVYRDDNDKFDRARHSVKFKAVLGKRYNNVTNDIKVEKVARPGNTPLPTTFEDVTAETVNETLTPGGTAILSGMRLKFDQSNPQVGIFLIDSAKNEYRVERILSHTGTKIVFQTPPALAADEYSLEVRVLLPRNKNVKTGKLTEKLTV